MIWLAMLTGTICTLVGMGVMMLIGRVQRPPLEIVPAGPDLARLGAEMTRTLRQAVAVLEVPPPGPGRPSFTCPRCFEVTTFAADVEQGYCPRCHEWTGAPQTALAPRPYVEPGRHLRPRPEVPLDEYLPAGDGI